MLDDYTLLTTQLVTLWSVMDPIGHVPLFLSATAALNFADRRRTALVGVAVAFGLLAVFGLVGPFVLKAMGISLLSFQIAGGMILFVFALSMVLGNSAASSATAGEGSIATAIYPVATPIIAGPGALLTIALLMDNQREALGRQAITLLALAAILALLLGAFLLSEWIHRVIGAGGSNLLRRVMGLILSALAVNMIVSALAIWLHLPEI
jgi:multiple antibiotic resistance protein